MIFVSSLIRVHGYKWIWEGEQVAIRVNRDVGLSPPRSFDHSMLYRQTYRSTQRYTSLKNAPKTPMMTWFCSVNEIDSILTYWYVLTSKDHCFCFLIYCRIITMWKFPLCNENDNGDSFNTIDFVYTMPSRLAMAAIFADTPHAVDRSRCIPTQDMGTMYKKDATKSQRTGCSWKSQKVQDNVLSPQSQKYPSDRESEDPGT